MKIGLFIFGLVCFQGASAQIGNNWVFGKFAGINFGNKPPQTFQSSIQDYGNDIEPAKTSSSISDCNGNLLFYTNGCQVWDNTHSLMANGDLWCFGTEPFATYIVPKPGTSQKYYLFYALEGKAAGSSTYYYAIVDMSKNGGLGKVTQKKQPINPKPNPTPTGNLTVVEHQNNKDYWLVILSYTEGRQNPDWKIYAYQVSSAGLGQAVTTDVNLYKHSFLGTYRDYLKATPNGQNLMVRARWDTNGKTFIALRFDFNKSSGQITNKQGLLRRDQVSKNAAKVRNFGFEASPNNQLIYLRTNYSFPGIGAQIFQVKNQRKHPYKSALKIAKTNGSGAIQLASNNKIYFGEPGQGNWNQWLGVIHNPNVRGKNCNVQKKIIDLAPSKFRNFNLPRIYQPTPDINFKVSDTCQDTVRFTNLTDTTGWDSVRRNTFVWDFGDGTTDTSYHAKHVYDTPGTYHVQLKGLNECKNGVWQGDTVHVHQPVDAGFLRDTLTYGCRQAQFHLKDTSNDATAWQYRFRDTARSNAAKNDTGPDPVFRAGSSGTFRIRQIASNQYCADTAYGWDSAYVEERPRAQFTTNDTLGCRPYKVTLNNQSTFDSLEPGYVKWQLHKHGDTTTYEAVLDSTQDTTLTMTDTGYYQAILLAFNNQGCIDTLTKDSLIQVIGRPDPGFTWQTDTQCLKSEVNFNAQYTHAHDYQWTFGNGETDTLPSPQVTYTKTGDYPIQLTASNEWCVDTARDTVGILVEPFPQARFSAPDTGNCRPFEVNFDNQSRDAYHYTWHTDSRQFDTAHLAHTYTDTGHFDVALIARNNQGCADTQTRTDYIYASPVPQAYFGKEDTVGCEHVAFEFRDSSNHADEWEWHFGNGDTSAKQNPSYTYTNEGQYDIKLIASNAYCADTQTIQNYIEIIPAPKPGFSIQYDQACTPLDVQVSNEAGGQIDSFYYTFGNGQTSNQPDPSVTYTREQEYTIKQQIRGVTGCLTQDSMQLKVYEDPEADYTIADTLVFCHEKAFAFKNRSRPEKPPLDSGLLYEWYFGVPEDSVVRDTMKDPVKRYSQTGEYPVEIITTNGLCKDSLEQYLRVNLRQKPELAFEVKDTALCTGQEIALNNQTQHADSFVWQFGNGQEKSGREIEHTYADPGYYDLRLTAFSEEGCMDSLAKPEYLNIKAHPTANFDFSPKAGCAPLEVNFTNTSRPDNQTQNYTWLTGTGEQFNQPELTHTYENPTSRDYRVTMIADNGNCADSLTQTVKVRGFDGHSEDFQLTNVTVQNDEVLRLNWQAHPYADRYRVYKKADGEYRSYTTTENTAFTDKQVNVHENHYFYKVSGIDSCGNASARSNKGRNILLQGQNDGNDLAKLYWNPYETWPTGIREYQIEKAGSPDQLDPLTVSHDTAHRDEDFFNSEIDSQYYRVHAIQKANPEVRSTSNILGLPLVPKLHVPNAFSPNEDGLNEVFQVEATGIHNFSLKIFNRWGEEVFSTTNPDKGWDGTYQGKPAPAGTYMYVINGEGNTYEQFSREGTVVLVR